MTDKHDSEHTGATPLGLGIDYSLTQGSREARQPWAKLRNRFAVPDVQGNLSLAKRDSFGVAFFLLDIAPNFQQFIEHFGAFGTAGS